MNEILTNNGGLVTTLDDPNCTHVVSFILICNIFSILTKCN